MDDLIADFIAETRQMLDDVAGDITAWADAPDRAGGIDAIFRLAHTIKGNAATVGLPRIVRLSHAAEDVLASVRSGMRVADPALIASVSAIFDRIGEVLAAIGSGEGLDAAGDDRLLAAVGAGIAVASVHDAHPGDSPPPRSIRLPVDLVDRLMRGADGLAAARDRLGRNMGGAGREAAFAALSAAIDDIRDTIGHTRLQRIDQLFAALPRMVRELAGQLGREVTLEITGGEIEIDRDLVAALRDPLVQVVRNAVDHGIAAPDIRRAAGKPSAGTLRITARIEGNQIVVEAADDGDGIDADRVAAQAVATGLLPASHVSRLSRPRKLALIFAPGLSTAPAVTTVSGRGVGLDVVRTGIERAGGTVEIETEARHGTLVRLRLPLRTGPPPAAFNPADRKTCLVVDDSRVLRTVARYMLEGLDFTVEEAGDGQEALDRCRTLHPDVILLDRYMPGMGGMEFLAEIGTRGSFQRPKILFCTADADAGGIRAAMAAGADAFVLKPFDRQALRAKLASVGAA